MSETRNAPFGNNGLLGPARKKMGEDFNLLARLRCNINVNDLPKTPAAKKRGRSRKFGDLLGKVSDRGIAIKLGHTWSTSMDSPEKS